MSVSNEEKQLKNPSTVSTFSEVTHKAPPQKPFKSSEGTEKPKFDLPVLLIGNEGKHPETGRTQNKTQIEEESRAVISQKIKRREEFINNHGVNEGLGEIEEDSVLKEEKKTSSRERMKSKNKKQKEDNQEVVKVLTKEDDSVIKNIVKTLNKSLVINRGEMSLSSSSSLNKNGKLEGSKETMDTLIPQSHEFRSQSLLSQRKLARAKSESSPIILEMNDTSGENKKTESKQEPLKESKDENSVSSKSSQEDVKSEVGNENTSDLQVGSEGKNDSYNFLVSYGRRSFTNNVMQITGFQNSPSAEEDSNSSDNKNDHGNNKYFTDMYLGEKFDEEDARQIITPEGVQNISHFQRL